MNAEETLDYTLGQLEAHKRHEIEHRIHSDAEFAERVDRLSESIHLLLDDGMPHDPPEGLAGRTLAFVAHAKTRNHHRPFNDQSTGRSPFRWADVAVAASIFFVGVLTILPLLQYARDRRNNAGCAFNLQQIGQKLALYASAHPNNPLPPQDRIGDPAGAYPVALHEEGLLPDLAILDCPYNGSCQNHGSPIPKYNTLTLQDIPRNDPERLRRLAGMSDYAYHVGYRQPARAVGFLDGQHASVIPLIADKPDYDTHRVVKPGNSPNHGRRGQNVLFSDGAVKWLKSRFVSSQDPDIFLNNDHLPRPGTHPQDSVLLPIHNSVEGK